MKNYYLVLGVLTTSTSDEIKKAYRNLAKKYHPDVNSNNPEAEEKLKEVNEAYSILSDGETRTQFDIKYTQYLEWVKQQQSFTQAEKMYLSRKVYLITFDLEFLKDLLNANRNKFHAALIRDKGVIDWLHFLDHSYLIVVNRNVTATHIANFINQNMPNKHHMVIEVDINNHNGWLPNNTWDWMKKYRKPVQSRVGV